MVDRSVNFSVHWNPFAGSRQRQGSCVCVIDEGFAFNLWSGGYKLLSIIITTDMFVCHFTSSLRTETFGPSVAKIPSRIKDKRPGPEDRLSILLQRCFSQSFACP